MTHDLKILPEYYNAIADGRKRFEVRSKDRHFLEGDFLSLKEYTENGIYTGRELLTKVTYILDNENYCKEGYVILGISYPLSNITMDLLKE